MLLLAASTLASTAHAFPAAEEPPPAVFALIVGVNASTEPGVAPLRYADDDAARYLELFRALGARTYVLSRLDSNTQRLHPQTAAEAGKPRRAELQRMVELLRGDIAQARARNLPTTLYFVYAGHGVLRDSNWYLTLEDHRLSGPALFAEIVEPAAATRTHLIIDACQAEMLALPRGPGGERRVLGGFVQREAAARLGSVGYLLSSSVSGETHEWAGFEAGVFSHEVRSGLYGAADANSDGKVSYPEIAAFVARANQAIVNDRYRPTLLARSPTDGELLLDLRARQSRRLLLEGAESGSHFLLESATGVRLLDFHGSGEQAIQLVRPFGEEPLYFRRIVDGAERVVPLADGVVRLNDLPLKTARAQSRGAAHYAFSQIFSLPFGAASVASWQQEAALQRDLERAAADRGSENAATLRRAAGITALGVGVGLGIASGVVAWTASNLRKDAPADESQRDTVRRNDQIEARNRLTLGLGIGATVAGAAGALILLWPSGDRDRGVERIGPLQTGWSF
jgi:hypothetical protein